MTFASEGKLEALAALTSVRGWYGCKCEANIGAAVDSEGNLAGASHHLAAAANALSAPIGARILALVRTLLCRVSMGVF
jgi:hypothetical protein